MFILYNSILHAQVRTFTYINYKKFYEIQTKRHTDLYSCFCASHAGDSQKDDKFVKLFIKTLQFRLTNNQRLRGKIAHLGNNSYNSERISLWYQIQNIKTIDNICK